jgi:nucleoside-diphosphate-sugar epimerase
MPITLLECNPRIDNACIMVTGGAGFIGSHLVDYLLQHNARKVIVVDDLSRARLDWLNSHRDCPHIRFVESSILDRRSMEAELPGVDVIFHLAAIATVMDALRDPERTFAVNAMATAQMTMAASQAGVRRFVFSSSREVYGDPASLPVSEDAPLRPKNVYGASKAAAEMFLSTLSSDQIEVVILRLANVYGPGDRGRVIPLFLTNALKGLPLTLYGGEQMLDLIWIGDVVETLVKAGFSTAHVAEPTNVGSGSSTRLQALARRIVELVGRETPIQLAPPRGPEVERYQADLTRAGRFFGLLPKHDPLDRLADVLAASGDNVVSSSTGSSRKLEGDRPDNR